MSLADFLTPKDTKEVKPGLFIQRHLGKYRQVSPAAWNGKINWANFLFGGKIIKSSITFIIILLLAYGFYTTTKTCREFQENPCKFLPNITTYCMDREGRTTIYSSLPFIENGTGKRSEMDSNSLPD